MPHHGWAAASHTSLPSIPSLLCFESSAIASCTRPYTGAWKSNLVTAGIDAQLLPLGSRVSLFITPCRIRGGRNGVWIGFSRVFSSFPLPQISSHNFSTLIPFHFFSSAPVIVCQAWLASILAIHRPAIQGLHRISSLDPPLSDTSWGHINTLNYPDFNIGLLQRTGDF